MNIIIVGIGNLGYYLTNLLLEENHEVIIIDKDKELCEKIANELDIITINGDATEPNIIEKADLKEADAIVVLTGNDEINLVISLLAKELGARQVATRISKIHYEEKMLEKLGIDMVIHPEAAAAGYIEELITKPEVLDLAFISRGAAEILEIQVTKKMKIIGKKIKEIKQPKGAAIVAIYDNNEIIIPTKETRIKTGNKILILAKREIVEKVRKMLK